MDAETLVVAASFIIGSCLFKSVFTGFVISVIITLIVS